MANDGAPPPSDLRRDLLKVVVLPALTLLLIPALGFLMSSYGVTRIDREILENIRTDIGAATDLTAEQKPGVIAFYEANPASSVCGDTSPELAPYRNAVCSFGSATWQFLQARRASALAFFLGLIGLLGAAVLGFVAFRAPRHQYRAFMVGWVSLTFLSAFEVIVQGVLATWLSYWVTALFMNIYVPKLILVIGLFAAFGVFTALRGIFRRVPFNSGVEGELVSKEEGQALWARLAGLAERVGTPAPTSVIAGIDDNFFVTEAPLQVKDAEVTGRSLFVSIPLLRVLSATEADAVLAHELAHFRGGDTAEGSRLGPALMRYDTYLNELAGGITSLPAFYLMRMFRVIFELARKKDSRNRELIADALAAKTTSADDLARALVKTAAYSSHRAATEQMLFEQNESHAPAGIALKTRVASGLAAHVATAHFRETVAASNVPHPFDSHPPLEERLKNVNAKASVDECADLLSAPPSSTWAELLSTSEAIEDRLWSEYEARFAGVHEQSLAYRYLPEGEEQTALVQKYFPPQEFPLKDGKCLRLTYAALELADGTELPLREILAASIDDGNFSTNLVLTHVETSRGTTKVNLRTLGNAAAQETFKNAFGAYWGRDQAARQFLEAQAEQARATQTEAA